MTTTDPVAHTEISSSRWGGTGQGWDGLLVVVVTAEAACSQSELMAMEVMTSSCSLGKAGVAIVGYLCELSTQYDYFTLSKS